MTAETLMSIFLVVLLAILYDLTPFFARADIFFGVTVNPAFPSGDVGRAVSARYRKRVWIATAVAGAMCVAGAWFALPGLQLASLLLQAAGVTVAFVIGNRAAKPYAVHPSSVREAVLSARQDRMPGGTAGALGPFALLAATAIAAHFNWERLPARLPVHWGLNLQPDRWVDRTPQHLNGILLGAGLVASLMLVLAYAILTSRRVNMSGVAAAREGRHRALNVRVLLSAGYLIALTACVPLLVAMFAGEDIMAGLGPVIAAMAVVPLVALVFILVRFAKQNRDLPDTGEPADIRGDATPDDSWYGGMLYINRHDPAIVVEKRFGFGYTLNMGNPVAWAITALFIALPFLLSALR